MRINSVALSIVVAALVIAGAIIVASGRMQDKQPSSPSVEQEEQSSISEGGELWLDEVDAALKNAATAEEIFLTSGSTGTYTSDVTDLFEQGLRLPTDVTVSPLADGANGYCIEATHFAAPEQTFNYSSDRGVPADGAC